MPGGMHKKVEVKGYDEKELATVYTTGFSNHPVQGGRGERARVVRRFIAHLEQGKSGSMHAAKGSSKKGMRAFYQKMDLNQSGTVTIDELHHSICALDTGLTSDQVYLMLSEINKDGDEIVEFEEFRKILAREEARNILVWRLKKAIATGRFMFGEKVDDIASFFRAADKDLSGALDKNEFRNCLNRLGLPLSDQIFHHVFDSFDSDGNGTLDYGEVYEMMNGVRPRPKDPKSDKEEHEGDQEEGDNWADFELGASQLLSGMVVGMALESDVLFCGIEKGLVISFDLKTGEHAYPIMHVLDVVNRLAENRNSNRKKATSLENISANEASLVATGFDNGVVAVFDPVESTCVGCWELNTKLVSGLKFEKNILYVASHDGTFHARNIATDSEHQVLHTFSGNICPLSCLEVMHPPEGIKLSKKNRYSRPLVFLGGMDGRVTALDLENKTSWEELQVDKTVEQPISALTTCPATFLDAEIKKMKVNKESGVYSKKAVGMLLFVAYGHGNILCWDLKFQEVLNTYMSYDCGVTSLVTEKGKLFAAGDDGILRIYDTTSSNTSAAFFMSGHSNGICSLVYKPGHIFTGSLDGTVRKTKTRFVEASINRHEVSRAEDRERERLAALEAKKKKKKKRRSKKKKLTGVHANNPFMKAN